MTARCVRTHLLSPCRHVIVMIVANAACLLLLQPFYVNLVTGDSVWERPEPEK